MTNLSADAALKDSGTRKQFETGAHRDNSSGKGRFDLLPPDALLVISAPVAFGARGALNAVLRYVSGRNVKDLHDAARELLHEIEHSITGTESATHLHDFGHAITLVAQHFEKGAIKYAARNWEQGIPVARYIDSTLRHTFQYLRGDTDEPHLIAAAWNVLALIQTLAWIDQGILPNTLDDLPYHHPEHPAVSYIDLIRTTQVGIEITEDNAWSAPGEGHGNPEANENMNLDHLDDRDAAQACAADGKCKCCTPMDGVSQADVIQTLLETARNDHAYAFLNLYYHFFPDSVGQSTSAEEKSQAIAMLCVPDRVMDRLVADSAALDAIRQEAIAMQAYTEKALQVYGGFLDKPFIDELFI